MRKFLTLFKRKLAAHALALGGAGALLRKVKAWSGVLTLVYHRILDGPPALFDRGLWSATPADFDAQVKFLRKHCDVIGPGDLAAARGKGRGRFALITFDDGYRDNYEVAFPILRSHGVSATFFLSTGFLDRPRAPWWDEIAWMVRSSPRSRVPGGRWLPGPVAFDEPDRQQAVETLLAAYKSLPGESTGAFLDFLGEATGPGRCDPRAMSDGWMTWDMVREMRAAGMAIGGHTVDHPVLARLPRPQQDEQIAGCKRRLETELGEPMTCFSYPIGKPYALNDDTRACLRAQGVLYAFTGHNGFQSFDRWDPHAIPRVGVERDTSRAQFRAAVTLPDVFARGGRPAP